MEQIIDGSNARPPAGDMIKDSDTATFMTDVIQASREVPVVVDFWAPWCGPCKQLGPMLEKAVREAKGAVRMVKVNVDENQEIAAQLRVQSIPAVYAFKGGRPIDGFVGALPESQIKAFIGRLTSGVAAQSPVAQAMEQAKAAFDSGDSGTASALYSQVLAHEPNNIPAVTGLARCYLLAGDPAKATALLASLPADKAEEAEVAAVRTAIELAEQAQKAAGEQGRLEEAVKANPGDHQARLDLATALFGAGSQEAAIDQLLESYRRDRKWNDDAARKQILKFFEALGPTHKLTVEGRRRLSSLMFS